MQKENKVYNITPANRVGSVQEYYFSRKLKARRRSLKTTNDPAGSIN